MAPGQPTVPSARAPVSHVNAANQLQGEFAWRRTGRYALTQEFCATGRGFVSSIACRKCMLLGERTEHPRRRLRGCFSRRHRLH